MNFYGSSRILVTGGAGFIGSHIAEFANQQERVEAVIVVDDLSNGHVHYVPSGVAFHRISILDDTFQRLVESFKPSVIFHEAAQPSLRRSIEEPDHDALVNIIGTIRVIQAARKVGAHLKFASTSAVYAPSAQTPFLETDLHNPNLPYGIAKHAAEIYIRNSGVRYTILRYGNVYGPRQQPIGENQLIPHCIRHLLGFEPDFAINGDGEQRRDFVFVRDIARANWMIFDGTYNVGTGVGTTVNNVCAMLAELAGKPEMVFAHTLAKAGEARHSILSTQMVKLTGWQPRRPLYVNLSETWDWYKKEAEKGEQGGEATN